MNPDCGTCGSYEARIDRLEKDVENITEALVDVTKTVSRWKWAMAGSLTTTTSIAGILGFLVGVAWKMGWLK